MAENKGCLFTEDDWKVWEDIDQRTKERSTSYVSGKYGNTYVYARCIFCGKKVVGYLITKHLDQEHRDKFTSWEEERVIMEKCFKNV